MKPKNSPYRSSAFISPYFPSGNNSFKKPTKTNSSGDELVKKGKQRKIGKGLTFSNALAKAESIALMLAQANDTLVGRIVLTTVANSVTSLINNAKDKLPAFFQETTLSTSTSPLVDSTKTYVIRFHLGSQSTKSVLEAERQHGSTNLQIRNSMSDSQTTEARKLLAKSFGFNQKRIDFLGRNFFITVSDYDRIYDIKGWKINSYSTQVAYGLVKEEFCNIKIRNSNTYHAIKFKLHLVKIIDDDSSMGGLYLKTFNRNRNVQDVGAIPCVYQITDIELEENLVANSILCYHSTSVNLSSSFKSNSRIVKTFSKKLNPGDTLDFRLTVHCGPGVRFDVASNYLSTGAQGKQPSSYAFIVEAEGTPCECVRNKDKAVFQGTSPGWYNYEFKKGIKLVKNSTIVSNSEELKNVISNKYAIKIHEREYLRVPPLSVSVSKIGPIDSKAEFSVVSTAIETPVYSHNINEDEHKEIDEEFDPIYDEEE